MNTREFLQLLRSNPSKELLFEYQTGKTIPKAYHITEVKSVHVDSVDCGGKSHAYDETVVQLWTNPKEKKERYMEVSKALKIMDIVDGKKPLLQDTPIFFEYGDEETPTAVYTINKVENGGDYLNLKLSVSPTACKPRKLLNTLNTVVDKVTASCGSGNASCC